MRTLRTFLFVAILAACVGEKPGGEEAGPCHASIEASDWNNALTTCRAAWDQKSDPASAAALVRAHYELGNDDEALSWFGEVAGTAREAEALTQVAMIRWRQGRLDEAGEAARRQFELFRGRQDDDGAALAAYRGFYFASARPDDDLRTALEFAVESYRHATLAGNDEATLRAAEALARVLTEVGDRERALEALDEADRLVREDDAATRARLAVYRGILQMNLGRPAIARRDYERALALGSEDADFRRANHLNLVKANLELGDVARAAEHLAQAQRYARPDGPANPALLYYEARVQREHGDLEVALARIAEAVVLQPGPSWSRDLHRLHGEIEEQRGNFDVAGDSYRRSIEATEALRREIGVDDLAAWTVDYRRSAYEALVSLELRRGRVAAALEVAERSRSVAFVEAFVDSTSASIGGGDFAGEARERLAALSELVPPVRRSATVDRPEIEATLESLAGRHVLHYYSTEATTWLVTISDGATRHFDLGVGADSLQEMLTTAFLEEGAGALSRALLPPEALPPVGSRLTIVTDRSLGSLAFAALRHGDGYLVESYVLSYAPSLAAAGAGEPSRGFGPSAGGAPAVFGDPLQDLPDARTESAEIAGRLGVSALVASQARREAVLASAGAGLLHFATHGGVGARGAWLQLADGRLTADEVVRSSLRADLVVLASCSSADRQGYGLWGSMTGAFLAAGSRSVLGTLGSVPDAAARELVLRFYSLGIDDPPGSLARAQRELIALGVEPVRWAPFGIFESRPLHSNSTQKGGTS